MFQSNVALICNASMNKMIQCKTEIPKEKCTSYCSREYNKIINQISCY